jgi:SNF2 family DNA or RNA helicase
LLRDYDRKETPAKFSRLATLIEDKVRQGRKVLVWSNFPANLERLRRVLARFQPAVVHGRVVTELAQPNADVTRERELLRFRTDPRCTVLLANPATLGEGVSLHQVCHEAIYVDRSFNAGHYLQSVDRIHRLGLAADVETNVTFLVSAGSIEERVHQLIETKARRLSQLMDDPHLVTMSLPSDEDVCPDEGLPSHEDLAALFDYLRGDG